jgi:hypothetical protein
MRLMSHHLLPIPFSGNLRLIALTTTYDRFAGLACFLRELSCDLYAKLKGGKRAEPMLQKP